MAQTHINFTGLGANYSNALEINFTPQNWGTSNYFLSVPDNSSYVALSNGREICERYGHDSTSNMNTVRECFHLVGVGSSSNYWYLDLYGSDSLHLTFDASGNLTVPTSVTVTGESANSGQAACFSTGGTIGHCTSVVGAGGACTCVAP
jgi:hypothetical protein